MSERVATVSANTCSQKGGEAVERRSSTLDTVLDGFAMEASRSGVPEPLITYAVEATKRKFGVAGSGGADAGRVRAYARGVVRRRSVRGRGSRDIATRYMLWSLASDLRAGGRGGAEIFSELDREWGGSIPEELRCELWERLCA